MKILKGFRKWIIGGCVWYTAISLIFVIICALTRVEGGATASSILWLVPFSLAMSAAGLLYGFEKMPRWARWLSHYAVTVSAFLGFVILPNNTVMQPSRILVLLVLISAVYWILFLFLHIFRRRIQKIFEED